MSTVTPMSLDDVPVDRAGPLVADMSWSAVNGLIDRGPIWVGGNRAQPEHHADLRAGSPDRPGPGPARPHTPTTRLSTRPGPRRSRAVSYQQPQPVDSAPRAGGQGQLRQGSGVRCPWELGHPSAAPWWEEWKTFVSLLGGT